MKHGAVLEKLKSLWTLRSAGPCHVRLFELGTGQHARVALAAAIDAGAVRRLVVLKSAGVGRVDDAANARLLNEARLMARLNHPNIVQAHAVSREGGAPALVLEYLAGPSLAGLLATANESAELTLELRIAIVMRVLSGLDYAHRARDVGGALAGVVHGGVSPDNVMLTEQGQVKLIDFACARLRPSKPPRVPVRRALPYVAPESFRGSPDVRVDVFAAGAILWELIAKAPLWGRLPTLTVMRRARASNMPRLRDVVPDIDPELEQICRSAVAPQPDDRYPSARAMRDDLERYLSKRGGVPSDAALGALVRDVCREQRLEAQRTIEARLSELGLSAPTARHDAVPGDTGSRHGAGDTPPGGAPRSEIASRRWAWLPLVRRRPASLAAAASAFLALLAWGAFTGGAILGARRAREESRGQPVLSSPPVLASRAPVEPHVPIIDATPAPVSAATDSPRLLELHVDVRPSHAALFLDGRRLSSNPLRAALVDDGLPHTLRAEAPGFEPLSRTLLPGAALVLDATLQPSGAAGLPGRGSKTSPPPRSAKRGAAVAAASKTLAFDEARRERFVAVLAPRRPGSERD